MTNQESLTVESVIEAIGEEKKYYSEKDVIAQRTKFLQKLLGRTMDANVDFVARQAATDPTQVDIGMRVSAALSKHEDTAVLLLLDDTYEHLDNMDDQERLNMIQRGAAVLLEHEAQHGL